MKLSDLPASPGFPGFDPGSVRVTVSGWCPRGRAYYAQGELIVRSMDDDIELLLSMPEGEPFPWKDGRPRTRRRPRPLVLCRRCRRERRDCSCPRRGAGKTTARDLVPEPVLTPPQLGPVVFDEAAKLTPEAYEYLASRRLEAGG